MKILTKNLVSGFHVNIIDRDLLLVLVSAVGIALAFGTVAAMIASKL